MPATPSLIRYNDFENHRHELKHLLHACVMGGASLGFVWPFDDATNEHYWDEVKDALQSGQRLLWQLRVDDRLIGSAQLDCATKPNARHRAELQKMMVLPEYRGKGWGRHLLSAIEQQALDFGRSLITLDTQKGSDAVMLYTRQGYREAGEITDFFYAPDGKTDATVIFYKHLATPKALAA